MAGTAYTLYPLQYALAAGRREENAQSLEHAYLTTA